MIDWLRRDPAPPSLELGGAPVPLAIRRHPRATRMTLRLAPDGSEVRVTLPRWGRTADAVDFARSRADWLESQLMKVARPDPPVPGSTICYRGTALLLDWSQPLPRRPQVDGARLVAGGPLQGLDGRVRRWLEREAQALMEHDLAEYCRRADRPCPPLRLSRAQRRWGSCAANGAIRINWRLIMAPDAVRRSVVAHEVAHLVHFDHSHAFHALLADLFEEDIGQANRWLRHHGRSLYASFG